MSETPLPLQFETAEGLPSGQVTCEVCAAPLVGEYHQLNGQAVCAVCRAKADLEHQRDQRPSQFVVAAAYGFGASIVGALLYWGFVKLTEIELGLMAIAVGWLVGKAVMRGSNRRGGRRYQVLAVALTYLAICMSYGAFIIEEVASKPSVSEEVLASDSTKADAKIVAARDSTTSIAGDSTTAASASATLTPVTDSAAASTAKADTTSSAGSALAAVGMMLLIILASPFLSGFENIIGLLIIAIGMYEAWKLTNAVPFASSGPFEIVTPSQPPTLPDAGHVQPPLDSSPA